MHKDCWTDQQGRLPCTCSKLHTENSDGTSPHGETRDVVDIILGAIQIVLAIVIIGAIAGYWSAR